MIDNLIDIKMLLLITSVTIGYLYITSDNNIILKKKNN
jgi:hypothetical protein